MQGEIEELSVAAEGNYRYFCLLDSIAYYLLRIFVGSPATTEGIPEL